MLCRKRGVSICHELETILKGYLVSIKAAKEAGSLPWKIIQPAVSITLHFAAAPRSSAKYAWPVVEQVQRLGVSDEQVQRCYVCQAAAAVATAVWASGRIGSCTRRKLCLQCLENARESVSFVGVE